MPRLRARVDTNQREIVHALRAAGCSVLPLHQLGQGIPDLLVATPTGETLLVECKTKKGSLTPDQADWIAQWKGRVEIVRDQSQIQQLLSHQSVEPQSG